MIALPPPVTVSYFAEMHMDMAQSVRLMTDPIRLRVVVSQNDTEESAKAAMNVPLLARAMHPGCLSMLL